MLGNLEQVKLNKVMEQRISGQFLAFQHMGLKMSAIIFNIIHWCHRSICLKASGVLNDLQKKKANTFWCEAHQGLGMHGLDRHCCCTRRLIIHGTMHNARASFGTTRTVHLLFGRKPALARECSETQALVFSSILQQRGSPAVHGISQPSWGRDGQREGLQDKHLPVPSLLDHLLLLPLKYFQGRFIFP